MKRYKNYDRITNIGIIRKKLILRFDVTFVFFSASFFYILWTTRGEIEDGRFN